MQLTSSANYPVAKIGNSDKATEETTADNFLIQAADKYKKGDYQGAIAESHQD